MITGGYRRDFMRLWVGETISMVGDWLTYVAVGVLAIGEGGIGGILGVLLAHTVPRVLVAPWAGRVADRYDRSLVLAFGAAARGVAVLGMIAAALMHSTGGLVALLVLRMAAGAFVDAAAGAAVPRLVSRAALARAHALLGTTWSVVFAAGVAAGGLLTAAIGPMLVLALDAFTFFVAALFFWGLPAMRPQCRGRDSSFVGSWRAALGFAGRRPALGRAVLAKAPVMIANGGAWMLLHVVAGRQEGAAVALTLGAFHLARAVGTGLGPLLWIRVAALRGTETGLRVSTGLVLTGVGLFAYAEDPSGQLLGVLAWGVGMGAHWATAATRVQSLCPDPLRGRMTSIDLVVHATAHGLGGGLAALGLGVVFIGAGGVVVWLILPVAIAAWATIEAGRRGAGRVAI